MSVFQFGFWFLALIANVAQATDSSYCLEIPERLHRGLYRASSFLDGHYFTAQCSNSFMFPGPTTFDAGFLEGVLTTSGTIAFGHISDHESRIRKVCYKKEDDTGIFTFEDTSIGGDDSESGVLCHVAIGIGYENRPSTWEIRLKNRFGESKIRQGELINRIDLR